MPYTPLLGLALGALAIVACASDEGAEEFAAGETSEQTAGAVSRGSGAVAFLVASDLHFGKGESDEAGSDEMGDDHIDQADSESAASDRTLVAKNRVAARAMELARSGLMRGAFGARGLSNDFRGLVVTGDVTDDGQPRQWNEFLATYTNPSVFSMPVYETAGNHDFPITGSRVRYARPSDVFVPAQIAQRNSARSNVVATSAGGSYAIKWGDVLIVNLGVKASRENNSVLATKSGGWRDTAPFESLQFLKQTLKNRSIVDRATRVVLSFHYPMVTSSDRMNSSERRDLYEAIKGSNVVAIIHGHRHRSDAYEWCGIPVLEADTPGAYSAKHDGTFIAAQISESELVAQTVAFRNGPAGNVTLSLAPGDCRLGDASSRCWSVRKKLGDISLSNACNVDATARLRGG